MLIYTHLQDPFHTVLRLLAILKQVGDIELEIEKIRILDFYLAIPSALASFRFPGNGRELRKTIPTSNNPYEQFSDPKRIFERMSGLQDSALRFLASIGQIDVDKFTSGFVKICNRNTGTQMEILESAKSIDAETLTILAGFVQLR